MKLRLHATLLQQRDDDGFLSLTQGRICALSFSADSRRLAVATGDRVIALYDESGVKVDKFTTKPNTNGSKDYIVRAIQFNSDTYQPKLAIAQSDNIVFVYKWSLNSVDPLSDGVNGIPSLNEGQSDVWSRKKTICNKFTEAAPVTCLVWPPRRPDDVIYGLEDGTVKVGILRSNTSRILHKSDHSVIAIAAKPDGGGFITSHLDGSIYVANFLVGKETSVLVSLFLSYPCPAYAVAWGKSVCIAGNDELVFFYDEKGHVEQRIDYAMPEDERKEEMPYCKEFSTATCNTSGDIMILGNFDWFAIYLWDKNKKIWKEVKVIAIENMHNVTIIAWNSSGTRIAIGSSSGLLDIYSSFLYQSWYKDTFEITGISPSFLTVQPFKNGAPVKRISAIRSKNDSDLTKLQFFADTQQKKDRYVVARTKATLVVCDTENPDSITEIDWDYNKGDEIFLFSYPDAFMVYQVGEIFVFEYGKSESLLSFCTEFFAEHLISLRVSEKDYNSKSLRPNKKVAFLLDAQTICVRDITTSTSIVVANSHKIDFIELNYKADLLLFRDVRQTLYIAFLGTQQKATLIENCSYTQWVPNSDIVVSQSRNIMYVHYNIRESNDKSETEIKGDIKGIEKKPGKTAILINEGATIHWHYLCEELSEFGWAIEEKDFLTAVDLLERMDEDSSVHKTESLWQQLYTVCIEEKEFKLAERAAAALGNVSLSRYLHSLEKDFTRGREGGISVNDNWSVKGKLLALMSQLEKAKETYLAYGKTNEAILIYMNLNLYDDVIRLAHRINHPDLEAKKNSYMAWLLQTNQEQVAALHKESEEDFVGAIKLYLTAKMPWKASLVISKNNIVEPIFLLESVAIALEAASMQSKAGEIFERIGMMQKALACYLSENDYQKAMGLSRSYFPDQILSIEERWADYLVSMERHEEAISHYVEAQLTVKALKVSIDTRNWITAEDLINTLTDSDAAPFYLTVAKHFEELRNFKQAEIYYVKAQRYDDMFLMYLGAGMFDKGHAAAKTYLSKSKLVAMYTKIASSREQEGNLQDAENMYLAINEPKWAISMYKKQRQFKKMIDLVAKFFPEQLNESHVYVGQQLKSAGDFKEAENHFISADESLLAVTMFHEKAMFEDALRIGMRYGNESICKEMAYEYAKHLGLNLNAINELKKHNYLNLAIEQAVKELQFEDALRLAEQSDLNKIQDLHLQYAMFLEDEDEVAAAEEEFVKAQKPMEAIEMYMHLHMWDDAARTAAKYEPDFVREVYVSQAKAFVDRQLYEKAEELFVRADRPELAFRMYQDFNRPQEALRLAERYLPHLVPGLQHARAGSVLSDATISDADGLKRTNPSDAVLTVGTQGDLNSLIAFIDQGNWQSLFDKVASQNISEEVFNSFVIDHTQELILSRGWHQAKGALKMLLKRRDDVKHHESIELYRDLARIILGMNSEAEKQMDFSELVIDLRSVLLNAVSELHCQQKPSAPVVALVNSSSLLADFEGLLMTVHYVCMCTICAEKALYEICARCSITLLHCDTLIPSDKRFYMAGQYCRKLKSETNLAFMLLNRYLDIIDAMESGDQSMCHPSDFSKAANLSFEKSLPMAHYLLNEKDREEVKDWVLSICMESKIIRTLPDVKQAVGTLYEGVYNSKSDDAKPLCIITGYPIHEIPRIVHKDSYVADKKWLEAFTEKVGIDPWTLGPPSDV